MAWRWLWSTVVVSRTAGMTGPVRRRSTVAPWCGSGTCSMVTPGSGGGRLSGPPRWVGSPVGPRPCRPSTPVPCQRCGGGPARRCGRSVRIPSRSGPCPRRRRTVRRAFPPDGGPCGGAPPSSRPPAPGPSPCRPRRASRRWTPPGPGPRRGGRARCVPFRRGSGRHGSDGVSGLPVVRHPGRRHRRDMRGRPVDADAGEDREAVVAHHPPDVRRPGVGGPADPPVPRHRRLPQPAVTVIPHGAGRDRAGFTGAAGHPRSGTGRAAAGPSPPRAGGSGRPTRSARACGAFAAAGRDLPCASRRSSRPHRPRASGWRPATPDRRAAASHLGVRESKCTGPYRMSAR